jgi:hypothetical protein
MLIEIDDSVKESGFARQVEIVSNILSSAIPRTFQPRLRASWSVLRDDTGKRWVMVGLNYDRITELTVFRPESLDDPEFMREHLDRLWSGVLRTSLRRQLDEPIGSTPGGD